MELIMHIKNVKTIKDLKFTFPLEKGLYAITGENASGKSTLVACASSVFFRMPMYEYFGKPEGTASIEFQLGTTSRVWTFTDKKWRRQMSDDRMILSGFFEGSVIFGNRFKDTNFSALRTLDMLTTTDMELADEFVRANLGLILHDDTNHYEKLYSISEKAKQEHKLIGHPYFYQISDNQYISQARMSTGENMLISILHSLALLRKKRLRNNDGCPCLVLLDEIELALHASALRRLIHFLKEISDSLDLSIFFSTHSLELLRDIKPQNIYYLERKLTGKITVTNPCYPAYATRNLYSEDGYGNDVVIFVEDDLAKSIIERVLLEKDLLTNIRIKVLPTGGWTNTIVMAHDVVTSRLLLNGTKVIVVLDRDIQKDVPDFFKTHRQYQHVDPDYLPISSLEKYLLQRLVVDVDEILYRKLDNYAFQRRPLSAILKQYMIERGAKEDKDGKALYGILINELRGIRKDRDDLVEIIVKHLMESDKETVDVLAEYLVRKISEC